MATRSLWRSHAKLLALTVAAASGGAAAAAVATSDDPATALKLCTVIPGRLARDAATAASIVFDYQYSLRGLPEDSEQRARVKHEVHLRSALKLQDLCFKNGGVYIKIGQHIGQLEYLVPDEYVQVMRESMLNKCPVSSFDQVGEVIKKELGETPDKIFTKFDPVPVASASLAQVHVARMQDGRKVAVKVQHSHMTDTAVADHATVSLIVNTLHRLFPSFDYRWLVDEIRESLFKELDFLLEAKNSEKCLDNFRKLSPHVADCVYAPKVYWNLSTSKLLVMEFMDAAQVNDVKAIRGLGIQPSEVSKLLSQAFAEMMFKHGFVHCDPHAANLLVRTVPSKGRLFGRKKPQLILLDHGLYKELDVATRTNYANLWKALVFADAKSIKEYSSKLGAGDDLYALFAGILTMRPWNKVVDHSVDHLVVQGTDRPELQMYASQYFPQIAKLLTRLPREILLLLKTNDCLRAVNNALVQGSLLETYFIIGKISSEAVLEMKRLEEEVEVLSSPVRGMKVFRPVSGVLSELICTNKLCRSYAEACMDLCCEIGVKAIEPFHHNPGKTWLDKHVVHQIVELPVLEGSLQSDLILSLPEFTFVELVIHLSCKGSEVVPKEIPKEAKLKPPLHWKSMPNSRLIHHKTSWQPTARQL